MPAIAFQPVQSPRSLFQTSLGLFFFMLCVAGCDPGTTTLDPVKPRPYEGSKLTINLRNAEPSELLRQYAREWSVRTGAEVEFVEGTQADIGIIPPAAVPASIVAGNTLPVPDTLRNRDHKYQWDSLSEFHSGKLSRWNNMVVALPILGEGHVLIYRKELFGKAGPPATWDEFIAFAELQHRTTGKPCLPPLPRRAVDLETEFYTIAASCDRPERSQADQAGTVLDEDEADRLFSFQYRYSSLEPRIQSPAFVHALKLMRKMQPFRVAGEVDQPVAAFRDGAALFGIVNLETLAQLQAPDSPVRDRFKVALIPGSAIVFDIDGKVEPNKNGTVNRIPYVGWGGWYGIVQPSGANPDMAWDFLADFANPDRAGAETITATKWGAGPFRLMHTDARYRHLWLGYELPPRDTDQLSAVLRHNLTPTVINYRVCLRTPNQADHSRILSTALRTGLLQPTATPEAILTGVAGNWQTLWTDISEDQKRRWIRLGLGLTN